MGTGIILSGEDSTLTLFIYDYDSTKQFALERLRPGYYIQDNYKELIEFFKDKFSDIEKSVA